MANHLSGKHPPHYAPPSLFSRGWKNSKTGSDPVISNHLRAIKARPEPYNVLMQKLDWPEINESVSSSHIQ